MKSKKETQFSKDLRKSSIINTSRIKNGKIIKPLSVDDVQAMVDKFRSDYPNGDTRDSLEIEGIFKKNRKKRLSS